MKRIKILVIKLSYVLLCRIGNIIKLFQKQKKVDITGINKIIFNRKDRIGDAVITKPLINLFSKYLKEELKLNITILVECSKYNSFVFEGSDVDYKILIDDTPLYEEKNINPIKIIINYFQKRLNALKNYRKVYGNSGFKDTAYIDLIGSYSDILKIINNNYRIASCNLGLYNNLTDYSINYIYGNSNKNLIESYINILCSFFNLHNFRKYVMNHLDYFSNDYNFSKNKKGILISIGTKKYRNLTGKQWIDVIKAISSVYPNEKIFVIDDNSNSTINNIKSDDFNTNVKFLVNNFSIKEFKQFASDFKLLIGIDGGGFNYIRTIGNSLTIYTIGNYNVRNIFTGFNNYKLKKLSKNYYYGYSKKGNKVFGYIYKKSIFLPSYNTEINANEFDGISETIRNAIEFLPI